MVKHIYISPHSDDVALSCGAQIISNASRQDDTLILNIFTSESRYSRQSAKMESTFRDSINEDRTAEDKSAWDSLGVRAEYLNLPEAILRKKFPFAILSSKNDDTIVDDVYEALLSYVTSYPDANFYFPAGIGNHIDHIACKTAAFRLLDKEVLDKIQLYEDIPYSWLRFIRNQYYKAFSRSVNLAKPDPVTASRRSGKNILGYLTHGNIPFPRGKKLFAILYGSLFVGNALHGSSSAPKPYHGRMRFFDLGDGDIAKKRDLVFHYESQIPMLFGKHPEDVLRSNGDSFSREVIVEISRSNSAA